MTVVLADQHGFRVAGTRDDGAPLQAFAGVPIKGRDGTRVQL
jgi:hypothetical protein